MRNETVGLLSLFFLTALPVAMPAEPPRADNGKNATPPAAKVTPTLRCAAEKAVAELSWAAEAEDPDGEGIFHLTFSGENASDQTTVAVRPYVPRFDPEDDLVRYRVGWASKDFRTTLRLYDREEKTFGDYDSRSTVATALGCENNLPIRGAKLNFAIEAWGKVSTSLALLDCIKFKREEAAVGKDTIILPVRFVEKTDLSKCEARLVAIEGIRWLDLSRVDGTIAPRKEAGAKGGDDKPVKKIERKTPAPKNPDR